MSEVTTDRMKSSIVPVHIVKGLTLKRRGVFWNETETKVFDSRDKTKYTG